MGFICTYLKVCTLSALIIISMSIHLFIYKKSRPHTFFHLIRFEIFQPTCIFTYKRRTKNRTNTFIQDHTIIRATRVYILLSSKRIKHKYLKVLNPIGSLTAEHKASYSLVFSDIKFRQNIARR